METVTAGPPIVTTPEDRARAATKRRAELRQAVWEASQSMSLDEIREFVDSVAAEIASDDG